MVAMALRHWRSTSHLVRDAALALVVAGLTWVMILLKLDCPGCGPPPLSAALLIAGQTLPWPCGGGRRWRSGS